MVKIFYIDLKWVSGYPFFPDAASCKKYKVTIHYRKMKLGIWLTDSYMADKAKMLKKLLDNKANTTMHKTFIAGKS